ncbi:MAG: right-handed parallel beta-helix repeat-containing protein, partial [Anaerolineae bacterium]|nr:right-handed parallel beta-helix repeat-containing protein [Anaerolineae bacterium]
SGNGRFGVEIMGIDSDNNGVYGNYIGTNVAGDTAVPNLSGIVIALGASNNRIGDITNNNGGANLISGNNFYGIFIGDANTINSRIEGNAIGNHNGAPSNGLDGIRIVGANLTIIGEHPDNGYTQYIEGNGRNGIRLEDSNQTIVGLRNVIIYNEGAGIAVTGSSSQNDFWPRQIAHNGGLPIDLGDDGHTANDPGDGDSGPNNLLNYPEVTAVNGDIVQGTVCGGCTVRLYYAELNPGQPGGGGTYMHSVTADFDGNWSANLNSILADYEATGLAPQGGIITADAMTYTAVHSFNSSEMSPRSLHQIFLPVILHNTPLPTVPEQVWFAPNMGSRDYTDLFSHPTQWTTARSQIDVFKFYTQNLIDAPCTICGNNTLNAFVDVQAFQKLTDWDIAIGVEAGAVKEWGCTGVRGAEVAEEIIQNVQTNGGMVTYLAMDEPYIGGELVANGLSCGYTMSQSADATTTFINRIRTAYPYMVLGDIEPYPYFSVVQLQQWIVALESRGIQLDFFHLDVDIERVNVEGHDVATDLWALRQFCQAHGIPFGVIFTSNWTDAGSEQTYFDSTREWVDTVNRAMGMPAHAIFQSWQGPAPDGVHAVPINLPENNTAVYSHTRLVNEGLAQPGSLVFHH